MIKLKQYFLTIISVTLLTLMSSCGAIVKGQANKHITEEKGAIPPQFGQDKTTVLFLLHHKSYNKYLKKNVKKIYNGKHLFITPEQLASNSKYQDTESYRFVFDYDYITYDYVNNDLETKYGKVKKFNVLDRKDDKRYVAKMTSGLWSKLQKVYLKKLNEKRLSFKN
ncbi:hypothetical protein [Olleya sp. R77988]|uniref:hypothetical protein n=1 Tax=Olleya sp. R77988 TaxID=3093875 RepID=UPI0037CBA7FA